MTCEKCQQREATHTWCDDGVLGFVHGVSSQWCERCVVQEQLIHARTMAERVVELEKRLFELGGPFDVDL